MFYIGIDPGVAGGIAVLDDVGQPIETHRMPETRRDLLALFDMFHHGGYQTVSARAAIEKVNAGVFGHGAGDRRMGVVSAFTFGRNVERCHMALVAAGIPYDEVLPVKWQTALGCRTRGDKNISKERAQQLFPGVKVTHAIADALLIAEFCRRTERGRVHTEPASKGLFDGKETIGIDFGKGDDETVVAEIEGGKIKTVARRRREGAPRRSDPPPPAARAVARRRGRSGLEGDRQRGV